MGRQFDAALGPVSAERRQQLEPGAGKVAQLARQRQVLLVARPARGHRISVVIVVRDAVGRRKAAAPLGQRAAQQLAHPFELFGRRLMPDRALAHDRAAQGAVADEKGGVDRELAVERVKVLAEACPAGLDRRFERGERHALDAREHGEQVVGVFLAARKRCQGEAAVTGEHGGDAVEHRGAEHGIPKRLGIVMRVAVDEPRRDHGARGIDRFTRVALGLADSNDAAVPDADLARKGGCAGAVDDPRADDLEVVFHGHVLPSARSSPHDRRSQSPSRVAAGKASPSSILSAISKTSACIVEPRVWPPWTA
jgi:hypothetical protein